MIWEFTAYNGTTYLSHYTFLLDAIEDFLKKHNLHYMDIKLIRQL